MNFLKKTKYLVMILFFLIFTLNSINSFATNELKMNVIQNVTKAANYVKQYGREKAVCRFNRKTGKNTNVNYIFAFVCNDNIENDGFFIANPLTPMYNFRKNNDIYIVRRMLTDTKKYPNGSWYNYCWLNPANNQYQIKHSYVIMLRSQKICIGSGYYSNISCQPLKYIEQNKQYKKHK